MSLAEIEKQVFELPDRERQQFVNWFYENEDRIVPPLPGEDDYLSPEVMAEVLRRREELETGNVKLYTPEEMSQRVGEALDEIRRSRH